MVMVKRRQVGDIVQLDDGDGEGSYLGRIDALGADRGDRCVQCMLDHHHDPDCAEWPNVELLDASGAPTGRWVYHVPECRMDDPEPAQHSPV